MKTLFFTLLSIIFLFFISCSDEQKNEFIVDESNIPKEDLSTPDNAYKSFIAYKTWMDSTVFNVQVQALEKLKRNYYSFYNKELADTNEARLKQTINYSRKSIIKNINNTIEKVDIQSDTRAEVIVSSSESTWGVYNDKTNVKYKYIYFKDKDKWLIEGRYQTCYHCDGLGRKKSYYSSDQCETCKGKGWIEIKE